MEYAGKAGRPLDGLDVKSFFDGLVFFGPVALLVRTAAWRSRALGLCCGAAGAVMAALGLVRRAGPALALMLALPLLLQLPACLLEAGENAFIDARGLQDDRAWALSVFHMSSSALETAFLAGSSAVAAAGAAACFWAVGAALAGCGAWAARAIGRKGLCIYSTENIE